MRFKLPNVFRSKKTETKPTGPSAADLLDAFYGRTEENPSYFDRQEESVQKYLQLLKELVPDVYEEYVKDLAEAKKVHSGAFEDIEKFDKVISEIKGTNLVAERVLVNVGLDKLNRTLRECLNRTQLMDDLGDILVESFSREVMSNLIAEDDVFTREDDLIKDVPEWGETLNECRDEYGEMAFEANYRIGMLTLLNDTLHHYDRVSDNPFDDYLEHQTRYNELLSQDLEVLRTRVQIFQNSCSEKAKSSFNNSALNTEMSRLHNATLSFDLKPSTPSSHHMYYTDGDAKSAFYIVAIIYTCACKALNQAEHDELMDITDKKVREGAEERLSGGISFEDFKTELSKIKDSSDAYNYQLNYARSIGLITDANCINAMHVRKCKANAVVSMINKARENGQDIVVFSPFRDLTIGDFKVYTRKRLVRSHELDEPFVKMSEKDKKSAIYRYKYPERYVRFFKENLKEQGVAEDEIKRDIRYTFDEDTGVYNFYTNSKERLFYNPKELSDKCLFADRITCKQLWKDINNPEFWQVFYHRVKFPGKKDVVSVLRDLHDANIRYYVEYDEPGGYINNGTLYYDPSREKDAKQLLQKYDYLDNTASTIKFNFDDALRDDWDYAERVEDRVPE